MARPCAPTTTEMGAQILLGLAAESWPDGMGTEPLLTHVTDHYVRIYLRLIRVLMQTALCTPWDTWSTAISVAALSLAQPRPAGGCPCLSSTTLAGPLWLGSIQAVIRSALEGGDLSNRAEKIRPCSER